MFVCLWWDQTRGENSTRFKSVYGTQGAVLMWMLRSNVTDHDSLWGKQRERHSLFLPSSTFGPIDDRSSLLLTLISFTMTSSTVAFNVIETAGLAGALLIITTSALSPAIQRFPTWYMVLCSGAVYSLSMLLLAMARAQFGPEPGFSLCLVQSALIYASPIW